jgi:hypothetical protein
MALAHEEIPPVGSILKVQHKSTPSVHQGRTGYLPGGLEERMDVRRQGIGNELHGVDSMIDAEELYTVTGRSPNHCGHRMLFRPPTTQSHPMKDRA